MSSVTTKTTPAPVEPHFQSSAHQRAASRMGMWIFLAQALVFFASSFVIYAAVRFFQPDAALTHYGFLNIPIGLIESVLLLTSAFAAALGARAILINDNRNLRRFIGLALLSGLIVIGLRFLEYRCALNHGMAPGNHFTAVGLLSDTQQKNIKHAFRLRVQEKRHQIFLRFSKSYSVSKNEIRAALATKGIRVSRLTKVSNKIKLQPQDLVSASAHNGGAEKLGEWIKEAGDNTFSLTLAQRPHVFFGLFFAMTGIHFFGLIIGLVFLLWIFKRAGGCLFGSKESVFSAVNSSKVVHVVLYWQLLTIAWVIMYPLLYLV